MTALETTRLSSWVAGEWAGTGAAMHRANPADSRDVMGPYRTVTPDEVERSILTAIDAQRAWSRRPAPVRGDIVAKVATVLRKRAAHIASVITREEGKTLAEARAEIEYAASVFEFIGAGGRWVAGDVVESAHPTTLNFTRREPLGVVAAITPWNFPVSLPAIKLASALAAGNAVMWKPASYTPASAIELAQCILEAGVPPTLFSLLLGDGTIGRQLVADARIRAVTFTGSTAVGQWIASVTGSRGARAQLEMGGKNSVVVLEDADIELAARETAAAAFSSAGQKCTAASRVIVVPTIREQFTEALIAATQALKVGDPTDKATQVGPVIHSQPLQEQLAAVAAAQATGGRLLTGGKRLDGELSHGNYMQPAVLDRITPRSDLATVELFGPVLALLDAPDFAAAIQIANGTQYGLAASVYTRDLQRAFAFISQIEAGKVKVNGSPTGGDHHVPFGGWKASGAGLKELGRTALDFFTEEKTVYINHLGVPA